MNDFDSLLEELGRALGGTREEFTGRVGRALRNVDPRLMAGRDYVAKERSGGLEGIPPAARGRLRQQASRDASEAVIGLLPFTPALLAEAAGGDSEGVPQIMAMNALAPIAGKVRKGVGVANALSGNSAGLKTQMALAAGIPLAIGASTASAQTPPLPEQKGGWDATVTASDPRFEALAAAQRSAQQTVDALRKSVEKEAKTGFKERSKMAAEALAEAEARLEKTTDALRSYQSQEDIEKLSSDRKAWGGGGLAVGAGLAAAGTMALRRSRGKSIERLGALAKSLRKIDDGTAGGQLINTGPGDQVAARVNEAYRMGGGAMPFERRQGALAQAVERGPGGYGTSRVGDDQLFGPRSYKSPVDMLTPALAAEGVATTALGNDAGSLVGLDIGPEEQRMMRNFGLGSLAAAGALKGGRKIGNSLLASPDPADLAMINAARSRLEREMEMVRPRTAGEMFGGSLKRSLGIGPTGDVDARIEDAAQRSRLFAPAKASRTRGVLPPVAGPAVRRAPERSIAPRSQDATPDSRTRSDQKKVRRTRAPESASLPPYNAREKNVVPRLDGGKPQGIERTRQTPAKWASPDQVRAVNGAFNRRVAAGESIDESMIRRVAADVGLTADQTAEVLQRLMR